MRPQILGPGTKEASAFGREFAEVRFREAELEAEISVLKRAGRLRSQRLRDLSFELSKLKVFRRIWGLQDAHGQVWFFDKYAGNRVIRWIETFCLHKTGEWRGRPLKLARWQRKIVRQIFGWKRPDGFRRFKEVWLEVARKNGKSTLAAAIALYMLCGDREPAAQIYSVAGNEQQARIVYGDARSMVELNPALLSQIETAKQGMQHGRSESIFVPLGNKNQHGLNPHAAIGDEVHEWANRDQYEAITTADGARQQALFFFITTAEVDSESLCGELAARARKVLAGRRLVDPPDDPVYQPDLYVRIFELDPDDDWMDEANWHKANPGLAYGAPKLQSLRSAFQKCLGRPAEENGFKRLRLNIRTGATAQWIRREDWQALTSPIDFGLLAGAQCFAGLDLAKVRDLSCLALWFPPGNPAVPDKWVLASRFWCPEQNIIERERSDGVSYRKFIDRGELIATPGNTTDFDVIERDIMEVGQMFDVQGLGFDAHLAHQMVQHLIEDGIPCLEVRQGIITLAPPTAELERMVHAQEMVHGGNDLMSWCVSNVVVAHNANGDYKPHKAKSTQRIDGAVAAINGLALGMTVDLKPNIAGFLAAPIVVTGG